MAPVKSTFSKQQIREIEQGNQEVQTTQEISSVVTTQGVSGLGLLITAVIQTAERNLTLYHAYLVINLLFLASAEHIVSVLFVQSYVLCSYLHSGLTSGTQRTLLSAGDGFISSP